MKRGSYELAKSISDKSEEARKHLLEAMRLFRELEELAEKDDTPKGTKNHYGKRQDFETLTGASRVLYASLAAKSDAWYSFALARKDNH